MQLFAQILTEVSQAETIDEADPQSLAINNALPQMAAVLKNDFVTYLPSIMETLLKDATRTVDMKVVTAKEAELEGAEEEEKNKTDNALKNLTLSIRGVEGPLQISMNTAALENKISAL